MLLLLPCGAGLAYIEQMRICLMAIGTRGDVQPFVVSGAALKAAGHDVHIAAAEGFAGMISAHGLTHHVLPVDFQTLLQEPQMQAALTSLGGKLKAYRWAAGVMNDQLSAIWRTGMDLAPDLILYHMKAAVAPLVARRLGVPAWPVFLQPGFVATSEYPQFLLATGQLGGWGNRATHSLIGAVMRFGTSAMIRRWVKATGIDPGPVISPLEGFAGPLDPLRIHAYSPVLCPRPSDFAARDRQTGYAFAPKPQDYTPPPDLSAFLADAPPPIYVGFGSMPGVNQKRVTDALLGALAATGQRAVVATGWGGFGDVRDSNVHVVSAVPHPWLFSQVRAVVHHGGSGTTHEGLRWGRPAVICPLFADQPFFGARIAALGAGPKPVPQKRLTAERLAAALEFACSDDVAARAETLAKDMAQEDGAAAIVDLVERKGPRRA